MLTPALVLSLAGAAPLDLQTSPAWGEFSVAASLNRTVKTVEIGTIPGRAGRARLAYGLRLTEKSADGVITVRYADTRSCAAADGVITQMEALAIPSGRAPHNSKVNVFTLDGALYTLRMPVDLGDRSGQVSLSSNVETPLADFVDESLAALKGCWNATPPAS
jgi:hypothetical protein